MSLERISVLIPVYKPSEEMINVLKELSNDNYERIIVIDDGSGEEFIEIFEQAKTINNVYVLHHFINMGKGRALKTGVNYYLTTSKKNSSGIVTASADRQYITEDIKRTALEMITKKDMMILGAGKPNKDLPFKVKADNFVTRFIFRLVSGRKIYDIQTGLRAIPRDYLPQILAVAGEKDEYEIAMLMELNNIKLGIKEIDVEKDYSNNADVNFKSTVSSWKIYKVILGYVFSSAFSAIVDIVLFSYFFNINNTLKGHLFLSIALARVISSIVNFSINRSVLLAKHRTDGNIKKHLLKYYSLAVTILALSYSFTYLLVNMLGVNAVISKALCDSVLFIVSFFVQKRFIFK